MSDFTTNGRGFNSSALNPELKQDLGENALELYPIIIQTRGAPIVRLLHPPTPRCASIDRTDALILLELKQNSNGTSTKRLAEITGLSKSAVGDRGTKKLAQKTGFVVVRQIPHKNPKMPPANLYSLSDNVTEEELQYIIQLAQNDDTQSSSLTTLDVSKRQELAKKQKFGKPNSCIEAVNLIKSAYRIEHLEVLAGVIRLKQPTVNLLSTFLGSPKQTTHSRLIKLIEVGIIDREKRLTETGSEYVYFLAPSINREEVINLLHSELGEFEFEQPLENSSNQIEVQNMAPSSSQSRNKTSSKSESSRFDKLVEKLPEFDSSWSDDLKQKWFASYERLMSMEDVSTQDR